MTIFSNCLLVMKVMRGPHTVMWDRQGLSTLIERSIIGGGLILLMGSIDMIESVGGRGTKTSQYIISTLH